MAVEVRGVIDVELETVAVVKGADMRVVAGEAFGLVIVHAIFFSLYIPVTHFAGRDNYGIMLFIKKTMSANDNTSADSLVWMTGWRLERPT